MGALQEVSQYVNEREGMAYELLCSAERRNTPQSAVVADRRGYRNAWREMQAMVKSLAARNWSAADARLAEATFAEQYAEGQQKDMRALCDASAARWVADGQVVDIHDPWTGLAAEWAWSTGLVERPADPWET